MDNMNPKNILKIAAAMKKSINALTRMNDAATLANLEMIELTAALDTDLSESLEDAATAAIQKASGKLSGS